MNNRDLAANVVAEVKKVIVGKDAILFRVLAAILPRDIFCWKISPA